jgi:hypothetical protein
MRIAGTLLVLLGLVGLLLGGIRWTERDTVIDFGSVEVTAQDEHTIPISPVAGGVCLIVGAVLLVQGKRSRRTA